MDDAKQSSQLTVERVAKSYPSTRQPLQVLTDASLEMSAGQSVAIVGPSGSGKSTLLHILGTLDRPDSGNVHLDGTDPFALSPKKLAMFRNASIGFIFQDHHLLPQLTVAENVLIPTLAVGRPTDEQRDRAAKLLDEVGLADRVGHLPAQLSGGERERVAIARALLMQPSLILADEPTGNLDRKTADTITKLLLDLQKQSGAILVTVTHSETLAAAMDHQMTIDDGKLVPLS